MMKTSLIELLGFGRAVFVNTPSDNLSEGQHAIISFVKELKFEIDQIYFCDDFPAVFIKEVQEFDEETFKNIANTHQKAWNFKKVLFLYVYNDLEVRIYNCSEKPFAVTSETNFKDELNKLELIAGKVKEKEKFDILNNLFSSVAIDTGIIWLSEEAENIRKKINLQRRVDKYLVNSLINVAHKLQSEGLDDIDLIHRIIMRSLFLLYLEDRGATDSIFYSNIRSDAKSYFDILKNTDATFHLYAELDKHFNGNVFTLSIDEEKLVTQNHLELIKNCFVSGYEDTIQLKLFSNWRLFDFRIIQIELLSEIYENFLSELDRSSKEESGTFYTPPSLVELILNEKLPVRSSDLNYNVKILDPACGSGIFLVESFRRLVKRYENGNHEKLTDYCLNPLINRTKF